MKKWFLVLFILTSLFFSCAKEQFGGLGIEVPSGTAIVSDENPYVIVTVFEGFAGDKAGLKENDIILKVDNIELNGLTQEHIYKNLLRGKAGTTVELEVQREDEIHVYRLLRQKIIVQE